MADTMMPDWQLMRRMSRTMSRMLRKISSGLSRSRWKQSLTPIWITQSLGYRRDSLSHSQRAYSPKSASTPDMPRLATRPPNGLWMSSNESSSYSTQFSRMESPSHTTSISLYSFSRNLRYFLTFLTWVFVPVQSLPRNTRPASSTSSGFMHSMASVHCGASSSFSASSTSTAELLSSTSRTGSDADSSTTASEEDSTTGGTSDELSTSAIIESYVSGCSGAVEVVGTSSVVFASSVSTNPADALSFSILNVSGTVELATCAGTGALRLAGGAPVSLYGGALSSADLLLPGAVVLLAPGCWSEFSHTPPDASRRGRKPTVVRSASHTANSSGSDSSSGTYSGLKRQG
mmetsp:Transcript_24978/g.64830  ORF Transcript_24978/g.64830 Transcript_24978/m.64830 type:complete len:347 (+) Transcript_24978:1603-2643(+)